jgi:hypothetical protein
MKIEYQHEENELFKKAQDIAKNWTRSRSGFGAFRHHQVIFQCTANLVLESGIFTYPQSLSDQIFLSEEDCLYLLLGHRLRINYKSFFENLLAKPATFEPRTTWALFWALATAEHQFMYRYTPYWSHEERLTGHLVSQIVERLEDFGAHWRHLNQATQPSSSDIKVYYADTAIGLRESITGADLGLIIQARYGDQPEFFKVVRFQAKKTQNGGDNADINLQQVDALLQHEGLGYFLFYHRLDSEQWTPIPTVKSATFYQDELNDAKNHLDIKKQEKLGIKCLPALDRGCDFASFITFGVADPGSKHGFITSKAQDAVSVLMSVDQRILTNPSRVMVISIGESVSIIDWEDLFREYFEFQNNFEY